MAGRPRTPTAMKLLAGTARPGRENPKEPGLPVRAVSYPAPPWLVTDAQEEWTRLESDLRVSGILTEGDLAAFAHYCRAFASAMKADGYAARTRSKKQWLYWDGVARKAWDAMSKAAQQLGLTPASRGKVDSANEETPDKVTNYTKPRAS